ncbi:MAG TPA: hypothetical protein V6D17_08435 [Candidatus Obscuribacterales bacterium]
MTDKPDCLEETNDSERKVAALSDEHPVIDEQLSIPPETQVAESDKVAKPELDDQVELVAAEQLAKRELIRPWPIRADEIVSEETWLEWKHQHDREEERRSALRLHSQAQVGFAVLASLALLLAIVFFSLFLIILYGPH